ncbi:histidine phosphatase family protein [Paenibacillus sp. GCM10028914]|uniref:histidine phosphatase family protein n=1 Tax=Paenibacillus sp. GCM10028914 TaxID=3273416 RepID=UPI0036D23752
MRHGMDEEGYRGGWSQRGLIGEGILQSRKLGRHLKDHCHEYKINTMISSDLPRAVETSREIELELKVKCIYHEEWREMNNGILAGMPNQEAELKFPNIYFNTLQMTTPFPDGETPKHFYERICRSFNELCRKIEKNEIETNVLLVTHGGVINILYYYLNGQEWTNKSKFHPIDNTSVHTVEKGSHGWQISDMNKVEHLNVANLRKYL